MCGGVGCVCVGVFCLFVEMKKICNDFFLNASKRPINPSLRTNIDDAY